MYEALFQTPDRPFRATPDVRFYYPFDTMEQTRQTVLRVLRRAEGPAAVMGGVGLGKSLLAQVLGEDLKDRFDVVRLHAARLCSRRAMLQNILFELKLPYRDLSEGELRLSLMERMEPAPQHAADGIALVVDEAQTLPTKLLEELRLITNFARQGQARARLVLLGSMHLEETFALPEMSSFNQRLAARCFLQPMTRAETADFVRHQFQCVGVDAKQVITRDALENVYVASEGIPRLVNQVMDHALILAIANDQYPISAALVQEAWSDLQQLPMSWSHHETTSAPVEFGSIDDLDQDFELEPEGVDELANVCQSELDWPAPGDLEDFGPNSSIASSHPRSAHEAPHTAAYTAAAAAPRSPDHAPGGRVVFDASTLFNDQSFNDQSFNDQSFNQRAPQPVATTQPTGLHTAGPLSAQPSESDHDLFLFQDDDDQPTAVELPSARNMFESWTRASDALSYEEELAASTDSTVDQAATEFSIELPLNQVSSPIPMPLARIQEARANDPFGQDFDEEFAVDASDVRRWQERQRARRLAQRHDAAAMAPPACGTACNDTGVAQTEVAATMDEMRRDSFTQSPAVSTAATTAATSAAETIVQPEFIGTLSSELVSMTGSSGVDEHLQQEIEDLISQLNFSAFSVEMDSVEQISPEFTRQAVGAANLSPAGQHGHQPEYASHPIRREEHPHTIEMTTFDDDRDLLIIEEDVPASVRYANVAPAAPTMNSVSYPQLFQQLRG